MYRPACGALAPAHGAGGWKRQAACSGSEQSCDAQQSSACERLLRRLRLAWMGRGHPWDGGGGLHEKGMAQKIWCSWCFVVWPPAPVGLGRSCLCYSSLCARALRKQRLGSFECLLLPALLAP